MDIDALDHFVMKAITLLCYGIAEEDLKTLKVSWSEIHESGQLTKRTDRSKSIRKYTVLNLRLENKKTWPMGKLVSLVDNEIALVTRNKNFQHGNP